MKTLSKALTIQTKQDKQSYLMFCPCGKCLLKATFFIGPCTALIKGENRKGKIFSFLFVFVFVLVFVFVGQNLGSGDPDELSLISNPSNGCTWLHQKWPGSIIKNLFCI